MNSSSFLVVGSGSIAKRHIKNLRFLYADAQIGCISASGRSISPGEICSDIVLYQTMEQAIAAMPAFAIVASPAPFHVRHAVQLLNANIPVLIEKPLSTSISAISSALDVLLENKCRIDVAYNLRFMPAAMKVKSILDAQQLGKIYSVITQVGQYLPDWRPQTDYRKNVSARKELGGGVLLELSHELDYITWMFGAVDSAYCVASNTGALEIDVEDNVDAILTLKSGVVVNLHMDFLQRVPQRMCKIIGQNGTLIWDVLGNNIHYLSANDQSELIYSDKNYDRNAMYLEELVYFSKVAAGATKPMVGLHDALSVLSVIDALHLSSETRTPVKIGAVQ